VARGRGKEEIMNYELEIGNWNIAEVVIPSPQTRERNLALIFCLPI
jgi:hypothetical protein